MAVTALAKQQVAISGTTISYTAANADGHTIANPGDGVYLIVRNGGGAPITVTVAVPGTTFNGIAIPDTISSVTNATDKIIPIRREYNDAGVATVTFSSVTSVNVAALVG